MWAEKPTPTPEIPENSSEKMPNEHPEKQEKLWYFSDLLRTFSEFLDKNKPNKLQSFLASIIGIFNGIDIKKGVTIENPNDISKIREAFRPIIDLDETGIIFNEGDFLIFNEDTGTVDFYPADKTQSSWHSTQMDHTVAVAPRKIPVKTPEQVEAEYESQLNDHTIAPQESSKIKTTEVASQLGRFVANHGPMNTGEFSCWKAVRFYLTKFGMKPSPRWDGNQWHGMMSNDSRFQKIEVNSLSDIPPGAILTFNGKWRLNGKPNGTKMNQKYGHVEIKGSSWLYYSYWNGTKNPGGSAREPQLHNNFAKWKEATGFTGAFIPIAKTHEEANAIKKSGESDNQITKKPAENRNFNEKEFITSQLETLRKKGLKKNETAIIVSNQTQKTYLVKEDGSMLKSYISSTAKNGLGNQSGSMKTPTGTLKINQKVGDGQPKLTSFEGREPKWIVPLATKDTNKDLITSRILTLSGIDSDNKNAEQRNIYFHGTNEEFLLGQPASHGCIRMKNDDIIEMFNLVSKWTLVQIA